MTPEEMLEEELSTILEFVAHRNPHIRDLLARTQNISPMYTAPYRAHIKTMWESLSRILKRMEKIEADIKEV